MKIKFIATLSFTTIIILFSGCYYDVEEVLYGITDCDTTSEVTYTEFVAPLLQNNCIVCHASDIALGGIIVDNYASVKTIADNGKLYGAISHSPGYSAMPKNGNKLDDCSIIKVKIWIDAGAQNN